MAKVQTLLMLTLIAVVQMYEMGYQDESANYQDDFSDIDMDSEAGLEMYHRLSKRNGPIWRPKFVNSPGLAIKNNGRCVQCCSSHNGHQQNGQGIVVGNGPLKEVQSLKAYDVHNGPWKVKKVSMTSNGDNVEPGWMEKSEQIVRPFSTMNGGQIVVDVDESEEYDTDIDPGFNVMPEIKEIPLGPIQYFMDNRKRDVVKQAYSKDQKQERPSSKPVDGNLGANDETKGQVNRIRMTIKPDRKLNKQNSLKTGVTKTT